MADRIRPCWALAIALVAALLAACPAGAYPSNEFPPPLPSGDEAIDGLHLKPAQRHGFQWLARDGGGYRWDIHSNGCVQTGTDRAFATGMYCQVNNRTVRSYYGWSEGGSEIELYDRYSDPVRYRGRYRKGLQVYRRIRVYRDKPLARWLDIFQNSTGKDVTIKVEYRTVLPGGIDKRRAPDGRDKPAAEDGWVITAPREESSPSVLHLFADDRAALRPTLEFSASNVRMKYRLTVPAGETVVLCHFLSQGPSPEAHAEFVKTLRPYQLLDDLPPNVRELVVNFGRTLGYGGVTLRRSDQGDLAALVNGDPLHGTIRNDAFVVRTFYGPVELPAGDVLGASMARDTGDGRARVVLTDGQIVVGRIVTPKLRLALGGGDTLAIPMEDLRQWSFRISPERPESLTPPVPLAMLTDGSLLRLRLDETILPFRYHGHTIDLYLGDLAELEIGRDDETDVARLVTPAVLRGTLTGRTVALALDLGPRMEAGRERIERIVCDLEPEAAGPLDLLRLSDGTSLSGRVPDDTMIRLQTGPDPNGTRAFEAASIVKMRVGPDRRATAVLWTRDVVTGELLNESVPLRLGQRTLVGWSPEDFTTLERARPMPPPSIRREIRRTITRLADADYRVRQQATEELRKLDGRAEFFLESQLQKAEDPEVRQRLRIVYDDLRHKQKGWPGLPKVEE